MSRAAKALLSLAAFGGTLLAGWALMTYTVPSKEDVMKVSFS